MKIGIYNPNLSTMGGGEKVCVALAEALSSDNETLLITYETVEKNKLESYFGVDLKKTSVCILPRSKFLTKIQHSRLVPNHVKKTLENNHVYRCVKKLNLDIFVNNAYNTEIPSPAPIGVFMCMFPHKLLDVDSMSPVKKTYIKTVNSIARSFMYSKAETWLDTYQLITANSAFTQKYIRKYWDRDSEIVYPISDNAKVDAEKKKRILNVGRFFYNNGITHHKRQDFLVDTFTKMKNLHEDGWELHLAGTLNENPGDMSYVIDLMRRADGYPVYFHLDAPLSGLKKLYSSSRIYWHATGYGADSKKNPERQEHFGISTVEAMSAGAVPVVIKSAGQQEIVKDGVNGYLWESEQQLMEKTEQAIKKSDELSSAAIKDAKRYDKGAFKKSVLDVFEPLVSVSQPRPSSKRR